MKKLLFQLSCLLVIVSASSQNASAQNKFGFVNIGASKTETITVSIRTGGTLSALYVLTGGAPNGDFVKAAGGTCAIGAAYADASSCTVNVTFLPKFPGTRYGGINLQLANFPGDHFETAYMQGTGFGPRTSFAPTFVGGATVLNLGQVEPDGQGTAFYTSQGVPDPYPGGSGPVEDGSFGSFPEVQGLIGELPLISPSVVQVDGAGNVCFFDIDGDSEFAPIGNLTYIMHDPYESNCAPTQFGKTVVDGAGNFYTTASYSGYPAKLTRQSEGIYVTSPIANLNATGIAVDRDGNVFFAAGGELYKETLKPDGTYTQTLIPLTLSSVSTVGIDGIGNLYLTDATGFYKESLQADGTYLQSSINLGSLSPPGTQIESVDLFSNLYLTMLTDDAVFQVFYSDVYKVSYDLPPTLSFATTTVGATSSDSPQTVTITNSGNLPLTFSGITYPADFSAATATGTSCTPSTTLAANASCTIGINFTPVTAVSTSPAQLSESVTITTNTLSHPGTQQSIQVTGQETNPPALSLSATSLAFPATTAGSVSAAQTITLTNKGTAAITLGTVALTGANTKSFVISQRTCGSSIAVGLSCTFALEFTPAKTGALSATLGIVNNTAVSPEYVTLSGTGN